MWIYEISSKVKSQFDISIFYETDNQEKSTETRSLSSRLAADKKKRKEKKSMTDLEAARGRPREKQKEKGKGRERERTRVQFWLWKFGLLSCWRTRKRNSVHEFTYIGFRFGYGIPDRWLNHFYLFLVVLIQRKQLDRTCSRINHLFQWDWAKMHSKNHSRFPWLIVITNSKCNHLCLKFTSLYFIHWKFIKNVLCYTISVRWKLVRYTVWFQLVYKGMYYIMRTLHKFLRNDARFNGHAIGWSLCISLRRYSTSFPACLLIIYFRGIFIKLHHLRYSALCRSLFLSSFLKMSVEIFTEKLSSVKISHPWTKSFIDSRITNWYENIFL